MLTSVCWTAALLFVSAASAHAQEPGQASSINSGDTAWMLISTALVMLMTPGLALFYGGMVRQKNALSTIMQSFICLGLISLQWIVIGYSLVFGKGNSFIGGLQHFGLAGLDFGAGTSYAPTVPAAVFILYQMMFAIITPALISGAFAERIKFGSYLAFVVIWATLVYDPIAHWAWGSGGWLARMGFLDFAGGTVVHISSGVSALVFCVLLGKRTGYPDEEMRPHNLSMTLLGTGVLWFGWFGFNGGSALSSGAVAGIASLATHAASAAGAFAWMLIEWRHRGRPTALGAATGAVAGLAGVTQGAGYVMPMEALLIGAVISACCYVAVLSKFPLKYDDSLDTFGVHGVAGIVGGLLTGVFATNLINTAGRNGLLYGNVGQLGVQAVGVVAASVYAGAMTWGIYKLVDVTMGLRVTAEQEEVGLDLTQHGETAYHALNA